MEHRMKSLYGHRIPRGKAAAIILTGGALLATMGVAAASGAASHTSTGVAISTLKTSTYGTILVSRTTVYTLKPSKLACAASCLKAWPEVLLPTGVTKARTGHGVNAAQLGTVKRAGGTLQVTYGGKALYWFSKDTKPGQIKGVLIDKWGKWSVVVTIKAAGGGAATTTTTTGGGGGGIGF